MATATQTGGSSATDEAKAKAAEAGDRIQDAAGQAQDKLHDAADQAREQASKATGQAKSRVREQVDQRSTDFGGRAKGTADDLRSVSEQLRNQGKDQPARLADQAAEQIERAGGYLERSDADRLLSDLEDFGRKRPWTVIGAGLAAGFVASRLLKTSSTQRYQRGGTGSTPAAGSSSNALPSSTSTPGAGVSARSTPVAAGAGGTTTRTGGAASSGSPIPSTPSPLDDLAERTGQSTGAVPGAGGPVAAATDEPPTGTPRVPSASTEPDIDSTLPHRSATEGGRDAGS
jgi:ElaB/YqjD/DUF883 family membrane-anchored ribosome-binding protein